MKHDKNLNRQLLTAKDLAQKLSISLRQVHRLNSTGEIPLPIQIGGSVRWIENEIIAFIDAKVGSSNNKNFKKV